MYSDSTVFQLMYENEFVENKDEKTHKKEGMVVHYLEQVLNEFSFYLKKRNRYKLSLVPRYVATDKPSSAALQRAA